jgi:hypothetical protein
LFDRLLYALQGATDPWADRVKDAEKRSAFEPITL